MLVLLFETFLTTLILVLIFFDVSIPISLRFPVYWFFVPAMSCNCLPKVSLFLCQVQESNRQHYPENICRELLRLQFPETISKIAQANAHFQHLNGLWVHLTIKYPVYLIISDKELLFCVLRPKEQKLKYHSEGNVKLPLPNQAYDQGSKHPDVPSAQLLCLVSPLICSFHRHPSAQQTLHLWLHTRL